MLFPINLVYSRCPMFDTKLKLRYLLSDFETLTLKKSGSVRLNEQRTTDPGSWLVDPVDDEDWKRSSTNWSSKRLTMRSKEKKDVTHPSFIIVIDHHFLTLHWLGNQILKYYNLVINYQWSQITFLLSIRRTGSQQIDFKVKVKVLNFRKLIASKLLWSKNDNNTFCQKLKVNRNLH